MIFIVDDDDGTRDALRVLVESEGLDARDFASGRSFLDGVRPAEGDCLILDLNMPGMNGFEVLEELRRRGLRLPAIVVTAEPSSVKMERALAAGALALLSKPLAVDGLLALIRRGTTRGD